MNAYDDEARLVFHYAREEANSLGQQRVGPEHLLLGLLRGRGGGRIVLESVGARLETLRAVIREASPGETHGTPEDAPSITPQSRRVMEVASHEARRLGVKVTSSQHILLALLEVDSPVLRRVLSGISNDVNTIRERAEAIAPTTPGEADAQEAAGRRAQQEALEGLLESLERRGGVPAGGQSRAELLSLLLSGAAPALLPRLEEVVDRWLADETVSRTQRRELVRLLVSMALYQPR